MHISHAIRIAHKSALWSWYMFISLHTFTSIVHIDINTMHISHAICIAHKSALKSVYTIISLSYKSLIRQLHSHSTHWHYCHAYISCLVYSSQVSSVVIVHSKCSSVLTFENFTCRSRAAAPGRY